MPSPRHPLFELTRAHLVEFLREPGAVFWTFGFPVLLAMALGIAFRNKPEDRIPVAVEAGAEGAAWATGALGKAPGIDVHSMTPEEAAQALRSGRIDLAVTVSGAAAGARSFAYRFDATRSEGRSARMAADDALQRAAGRRDPGTVSEVRVAEPGARYIDFLLPGLIGLNLMGSGLWGIGWAVVEARNRKLLKRFAATPMRRWHFLASFFLARLVFLAAEVVALVGFGALAFDVTVRGSIASLGVVSLAGSLMFAGIALLIAARPQSMEVASGWINFVMLPMWLLSGSFFSYERFPDVTHPFIRALPLTALNDALRAITNDGASIVSTWPQLIVLAVWGGLSFHVALRIFRWQ